MPGLVKWKTPSRLLQSYGTGNFKFFMPPDFHYPIGDTYSILPPLPIDAPGINMYRYHPLQPPRKEVFLFALLSQFHPYVFLQSRYGPRGSMAVVRARNDRYLDIVMRLEPVCVCVCVCVCACVCVHVCVLRVLFGFTLTHTHTHAHIRTRYTCTHMPWHTHTCTQCTHARTHGTHTQ